MEYDPKKVKELEDEVQKETRLMYKYKGWVSKKQNALMKIAENLQAEKDKALEIDEIYLYKVRKLIKRELTQSNVEAGVDLPK